MADATLSVTPSALEAFAKAYLRGLGASIRTEGAVWKIRLPAHVDVDFADSRDFKLATVPENLEGWGGKLLSPESEFTQQLLDEAAGMAEVGHTRVTSDRLNGDYHLPAWVSDARLRIRDAEFHPYYDRRGLSVFVHVSVETVSEYQSQFLEAVTVDLETNETLPRLTDLLLENDYRPQPSNPSGPPEEPVEEVGAPGSQIRRALEAAQEDAVLEIEGEIEEIRQTASQSAYSEFQEYRKLQEQRIRRARRKISKLHDRLQNLSRKLDKTKTEEDRVQVLQTRQGVREERDEIKTELKEILREKDQHFQAKREEIYDRHSLQVETEAVALTFVDYERGELSLRISQDQRNASLRVPYGIGAGVTQHQICDACDATLDERNRLKIGPSGLGCETCC